MFYNYGEMNNKLPFAMMNSHVAQETPQNYQESYEPYLIDLKFNRKPIESKAYICFGVGRNALGLPLELPRSKSYLIPELQKARVKFKLVDK